jgi:hypothetical protein
MCEVDAALFVVHPSFVTCLLGTLAFVVASVGLVFVQFLLTVNCDVAIYNLTTTLLLVRWFLMISTQFLIILVVSNAYDVFSYNLSTCLLHVICFLMI